MKLYLKWIRQYNCRPRGHRAFRGANTPNQRKIRFRGAPWFPLGITQRNSGALYCGGHLRWNGFLAFFACSARFGKNGDFLAAQPPERSFYRPVRWYLRYLRARDVQSATLPLFTSRPAARICPYAQKNAPECPNCTRKTGGFPSQERDFWHSGTLYRPMGGAPPTAFSTPPKSLVTRRSAHQKSRFAPKNKKEIARRNRTNDHQTATTDNHGQ